MNDAALAAGILGGRVDFAVLWNEYWERVYQYVRRKVRNAELAKDLTNCVMERANDELKRFDAKRGSLWSWLRLLAISVVTAYLRKRRFSVVSLDAMPDGKEPSCEGPEEIHERAEVWRAVEELPEPERGVLLLYFREGYSFAEIARMQGKPASTVKDTALRGLEMLRRRL
jgi:RNA polymerase sigma-70 factor, ECF subfamily